MKYYEVTLGANAAHEQNTLMAKLKTAGAEVIQSSSGLIVKSAQSISDLLGGDVGGVNCSAIDPKKVGDYSKDIQAFLNG